MRGPLVLQSPVVCNPLRLTRSPFALHSHSAHSRIHSALPGSPHCPARLTQNKRFLCFFHGAHARPERLQASPPGVHKDVPATLRRGPSRTPRSGCTGMPPELLPPHKCIFSRSPSAKDPELGVRWCRAFAGLKAGVGIPAPHEEIDAQFPARDAQPLARVPTPGQHFPCAIARTYRARQLGGSGPEINHLSRGIHGAAARAATQQRRTGCTGCASLSLARTLGLLPVPSRRARLACAVTGPALIGPLHETGIPIGRAHRGGRKQELPGGLLFQPFL